MIKFKVKGLQEFRAMADKIVDVYWPEFLRPAEDPARGYVVAMMAAAMKHEQDRILYEIGYRGSIREAKEGEDVEQGTGVGVVAGDG